MSDLVGEIDIILHENKQLREQNRVLATKLSEAAVLAKEIKDEFDMCTHECERCGESDPMTTFDIYGTVVKLAALTATSQPAPPYKEWCRHPEECAGLASCPRNPTCAD